MREGLANRLGTRYLSRMRHGELFLLRVDRAAV